MHPRIRRDAEGLRCGLRDEDHTPERLPAFDVGMGRRCFRQGIRAVDEHLQARACLFDLAGRAQAGPGVLDQVAGAFEEAGTPRVDGAAAGGRIAGQGVGRRERGDQDAGGELRLGKSSSDHACSAGIIFQSAGRGRDAARGSRAPGR